MKPIVKYIKVAIPFAMILLFVMVIILYAYHNLSSIYY